MQEHSAHWPSLALASIGASARRSFRQSSGLKYRLGQCVGQLQPMFLRRELVKMPYREVWVTLAFQAAERLDCHRRYALPSRRPGTLVLQHAQSELFDVCPDPPNVARR